MATKPTVVAGILLAGFAVVGAALVALIHELTAERIAANERQALLDRLYQVIPGDEIDNDLLADTFQVSAPVALGAERTTIYRGRLRGQPVAVAFAPVEAPGYSGTIRLLVAVRENGRVAGVRVIRHSETPGLGDKIELRKSEWITQFAGRFLGEPPAERWQVRRDGGAFDQLTGATITPRAVVGAVRRTLDYYAAHQDRLFADPATGPAPSAATEN